MPLGGADTDVGVARRLRVPKVGAAARISTFLVDLRQMAVNVELESQDVNRGDSDVH